MLGAVRGWAGRQAIEDIRLLVRALLVAANCALLLVSVSALLPPICPTPDTRHPTPLPQTLTASLTPHCLVPDPSSSPLHPKPEICLISAYASRSRRWGWWGR